MQQTEKYQLNLIEKTDAFSPDALNANTQKVEAALEEVTAHADAGDAAVTAAFQAGDAALDGRVTALEAHHIYVGNYTGNGSSFQNINLGFTPGGVVFMDVYSQTRAAWAGYASSAGLEVMTNGFRVSNSMNNSGTKYYFMALN